MSDATDDELREAEFLAKSEAMESFWAIRRAETEEQRDTLTKALHSRTDAIKESDRSEAYKSAWMTAFAAELQRLEEAPEGEESSPPPSVSAP